MAYLDATDLNDLQQLDVTNESRFNPLGLVNLAADSSNFVSYISESTKAELAKMPSNRNAQIPVIKESTIAVTSSPSFTIPANLGESDMYTFVPYDLYTGFNMFRSTFEGNVIAENEYKLDRMAQCSYGLGKAKEVILAAVAETIKTQQLAFTTQVSHGSGTYSFDTGADVLTVSLAAQNDTMFYSLADLMSANELGGQYRLVTSRAGLTRQKVSALQYSAQNEKNLKALGMLGLDRMYESNTIAAGSDIFNGYFVRDGGLGLIGNHPWDFRNGTEFAGNKWAISDMVNPFTKSRLNVFTKQSALDATAVVNNSNTIMTSVESMGLWDRFYVVYPYNSDRSTRASDVVSIKGAAS